ncbi:hypothetical protein AYI68_g4286 [Smittium mucronatum]|uniref:Uncharacterized protein n=1 Tax=Smittium mucronatum TaxID=133383 RepID=A0A1R0GXI8_9FUNG|nr:hypothetical protein AYI68_g4286 [Smittium mucronatum]
MSLTHTSDPVKNVRSESVQPSSGISVRRNQLSSPSSKQRPSRLRNSRISPFPLSQTSRQTVSPSTNSTRDISVPGPASSSAFPSLSTSDQKTKISTDGKSLFSDIKSPPQIISPINKSAPDSKFVSNIVPPTTRFSSISKSETPKRFTFDPSKNPYFMNKTRFNSYSDSLHNDHSQSSFLTEKVQSLEKKVENLQNQLNSQYNLINDLEDMNSNLILEADSQLAANLELLDAAENYKSKVKSLESELSKYKS